MPLLGLFSKKSKSPLKLSSGIPSTSNVSLSENGWVDINTAASASTNNQQQQQRQRQRQPPSASSSPFNNPARASNDACVYDPPIRHSSLFPSLQDDKNTVHGSTQAPNGPDTRPASNKLSFTPSHPLPPLPSKKSLFNWYSSSKERSHTTTIPSIKSTSDSSDASFNLKSFRHVRPESPSFSSTTATTAPATAISHPPSPRASPALVPVPTSAPPPAPVSFQVTSRKPRLPPPSLLSLDISPTSSYSANPSTSPTSVALPSQSKVAAGVFRQAARRSATSLTLGEPIVVAGESLEGQGSGGLTLSLSPGDDFKEMTSFLSSPPPKLPPFSFSFSNPDLSSNSTESVSINSIRPPRSRPPPSLANQPSSSSVPYTLLNHSSTSVSSPALAPNLPSLSSALPPPSISALALPKPAPFSKSLSTPPGKRNNSSSNVFGNSSSDTSDSEEEESKSESDESDTGLPRVSRRRTVRPRNNTTNATTAVTPGRSRAATTTAAPPRPNPIGLETSNSEVNLSSSIPSQSVSITSNLLLTDSNNPSLGYFPGSASTPSDAAATPSAPFPPSTHSVYSNGGVRPRASASVGALHPSAKEARASVVLANSRLSTATNLSTPKAMSKPLIRNTGSDTSESSESEADSDEEDAPLSKLVPPKRPGTSMSSHSTASISSLQKKPLIDLSAPSTFSGRPVGAPAPISREEEEMPKPRILGDMKGRSSPILKNTKLNLSVNERVVPSSHPSHSSQQQQSGKKPPKSSLSLSSGSTMSSPSSSGASLATSSRGIGGTSSDTSISPSDRNLRYHSFANGGIDPVGGSSGSRTAGSGSSPSRALHPNSPSANLPSVVVPPMRPFVRRDSPTASSTGDSSSGKVPLTPKEENEIRRSIRPPSALISSKDHSRPTHGRKSSVTFEDDVSFMDNGTRTVRAKAVENESVVGEAKRRDRRRSEARAAIELGKVVNGPPPVDEDEITLDARAQAAWPQFGIQMPMQPMPMPTQSMFGMGGNMGGMAIGPQMQMTFPNPMPNSDPAFLAAHHQAMAIAKQTFQYTVAQQALAAANEEWERGSTMTGYMPVNYMNMNMRGSMVFPPAPASMYAGNMGGGSLVNGFSGMGGAAGAWGGGTRSVYGGSFGPATTTPMAMRLSTYSSTDLTAMNTPMMTVANASGSSQAAYGGQQRPGMRQRTRTAPSSQTPPVPLHAGAPPMPSPGKSAVRTRAPAPPSSFRGVTG